MPPPQIFPSPLALASAARDLLLRSGHAAIQERGVFRLALSGGRGPLGLFARLGQEPEGFWGRTRVYWVDERRVPVEDPESNFGSAQRSFLGSLSERPEVHPMPLEGDGPAAADAYARELAAGCPGRPPILDLVLLGLGADGHTASLFPGDASVEVAGRWCVPVRHPATGQERLTLTLPVLNAARTKAFLTLGADKAPALRRALAGDPAFPAGRVRDGEVHWLVDAAAAGTA